LGFLEAKESKNLWSGLSSTGVTRTRFTDQRGVWRIRQNNVMAYGLHPRDKNKTARIKGVCVTDGCFLSWNLSNLINHWRKEHAGFTYGFKQIRKFQLENYKEVEELEEEEVEEELEEEEVEELEKEEEEEEDVRRGETEEDEDDDGVAAGARKVCVMLFFIVPFCL